METTEKIKIWFAGNDDAYSTFLTKVINSSNDMEMSQIFHSKKELNAAAHSDSPDILILDLEKNKKKLLKDVTDVYSINERVKIILLLDDEDDEFIVKAICRGVYDFFIRSKKELNINDKIKEVYRSKNPLHSVMQNYFKRTLETVQHTAIAYNLSPREKEILNLMISGLTKKKMAAALSISFHTIDSHFRKIYRKLGVKNKTEAVSKALKEQLITA